MTACPACTEFDRNPRTHSFNSGCLECQARSIASSPTYFNAADSKTIPAAYRAVLQRAFGGDWIKLHERVKHYAALIKQARDKA